MSIYMSFRAKKASATQNICQTITSWEGKNSNVMAAPGLEKS